jgi:hypothetical protein
MIRGGVSLTLVLVMLLLGIPRSGGTAQRGGQIAGRASTSDGNALANQAVQLRDLSTVSVVSSTFTNAFGEFVFAGLATGSYVVELVDAGRVIAASGVVTLTAQSPVMTGVSLMTVQPIAETGDEARSFWTSRAGQIILAAIAAGAVSGLVVAAQDSVASPSE